MSETCSICGLPKEICACQTIEKETTQKIKVYSTKKRFNKLVTLIEGLRGDELDRVTKDLKHKLACGGSSKDGVIVLQGDHKLKAAGLLEAFGYPKDLITIV